MNTKTVIFFVGAVLILSVLGIIGLALTGHPIPDVLQNIAVGSLTGLVGLLVPNTLSARGEAGHGSVVHTGATAVLLLVAAVLAAMLQAFTTTRGR